MAGKEKLTELPWQPLCWKCSRRITMPSVDMPGAEQFVGCADEEAIHDYADAKIMCPLHPDKRDMG